MKEEVKNIYKLFPEKVIKKWSSCYIKLTIIEDFLKSCNKNNLAILWFDWMYISKNETMWFVDVIFDFSYIKWDNWKEYRDKINKNALSKISNLKFKIKNRLKENPSLIQENLCVDVVLMTQEEYIKN